MIVFGTDKADNLIIRRGPMFQQLIEEVCSETTGYSS
jgi:hypothetical protein